MKRVQCVKLIAETNIHAMQDAINAFLETIDVAQLTDIIINVSPVNILATIVYVKR